MSRFVGYCLLVVAALMAIAAWMRVSAVMMLAENGIQRTGATSEIILIVLCGVVVPIGIAALLLKK